MKNKFPNICLLSLFLTVFLVGCSTMASLERGVTKPWIEIAHKKRDMKGKVSDICYRLNLTFSSKEVQDNIDTYRNCIDACCWYNTRKKVAFNFNENYNANLYKYGVAYKFKPEKITIDFHRTSLIGFMAAKVTPSDAISKKGYVKLEYKAVTDDKRLAELEKIEIERQKQLKAQQRLLEQKELARKKYPKKLPAKTSVGEGRALSMVKSKISTKLNEIYSETQNYAEKNNMVSKLSGQTWVTTQTSKYGYKVTCIIQAKVGYDEKNMEEKWISCGTWHADVSKNTIIPLDKTAKKMFK